MTEHILLHLADIHIRDVSRDIFAAAIIQLRASIAAMRAQWSEVRVTALIVGDLFHGKTQLSAENIVDCFTLLDTLAQVARDIIVIPGNHDANLNNHDKIDLPGPILDNSRAFRECSIHYLRKSGWYHSVVPGLSFYVFSPIDPREFVAECTNSTRSIALVHDFIDGMNFGGLAHRSPIRSEYLEQFDAVICGHVHDYMQLPRRAQDKHSGAVYCGSFTQLTIGESFEKGFVVWKFAREITHKFIRLKVPGAQIKISVTPSGNSVTMKCNMLRAGAGIPTDSSRIVIDIRARIARDSPEVARIVELIRGQTQAPIEFVSHASVVSHEMSQHVDRGMSSNLQHELITTKLRAGSPNITDELIRDVIALHVETCAQVSADQMHGEPWHIHYLEWSNLFCYGTQNYINFEELSGIIGLTAPNRRGKSAIIDIITLALFNEPLRGSAQAMIRRGCADGSLRCIWSHGTEMCEIVRKWDTKGRGYITYTVAGQNRTGSDLKTTYLEIARKIGTIDDFQCTVLIPQHGAESFIDMTDSRKRAVLARILGLDILDGAQEFVSKKIHDNQIILREVGAATTEITSKLIAGTQINAGESIIQVLERADIDSRAKLDGLRTLEADLRAKVESLEKISAPIAPVARAKIELRIAEIDKIHGAKLRELDAIDKSIDKYRAELDKLRSQGEISGDIDDMRAKYIRLANGIPPHIAILSHSRDIDMNTIQAKLISANAKIEGLKNARNIAIAMETARVAYKKSRAEYGIVVDKHKLLENNVDVDQCEKLLARAKDTLSALPSCARICKCGRTSTQDERNALVARLEGILARQFARDLVIPDDCPRTIVECLRVIDTIRSHFDGKDALHLAHVSIALLRAVGESDDVNCVSTDLECARFCAKWHNIIDTRRILSAEVIDLREKICMGRLIQCLRLYSKTKQEFIAAIHSCGISAKNSDDVSRAIFDMERAIATMVEIRENSVQIARAATIEREMKQLEESIVLKRDILRVSSLITDHCSRVVTLRAQCEELSHAHEAAQEELCVNEARDRAWKDYDETRNKLSESRGELMRVQATVASFASEVAELIQSRARISLMSARMEKIHHENHILTLYRTTIDSKTGIQYNLMGHAIDLIEREVCSILEPITDLKLRIILGTGDVRIASAGSDSILARSTVTKTMRVIVRNGSIEHGADMCSGFQRFILNIALRRAFLQTSVRARAQFMIIDEGFGCLDQINMVKVCDKLPELAYDLKHMIVVSHIEDMRGSIDEAVHIDCTSSDTSMVRCGTSVDTLIHDIESVAAGPGSRIRRKTSRISAETAAIDPSIIDCRADGTNYCNACGRSFKVLARHVKSVRHAKKMVLFRAQK